MSKGKVVRVIKEHQHFGEELLYGKCFAPITAVATKDTLCLTTTRQYLANQLGDPLEKVILRNIHVSGLNNSVYLKNICNVDRIKILKAMTIRRYSQGEFVFKKGDVAGEVMLFLIKGNLITVGFHLFFNNFSLV